MSGRLFAFRTDRPWLIALFALTTWAQPFVLATATWSPSFLWGLFPALTALPLVIADPLRFRQTCLTVGAVVLGTQILFAAPYDALPPLFAVALFPAGALLLLAGWKSGALARGTLAALLLVAPYATGIATLCPTL